MTHHNSNGAQGTIIAITSGKGGVGKTSLVINLATSLARLGFRVGILDADFGLGNIDVMLGLTPTLHLGHALSGERDLDDVILQGPLGVKIIPAGTGIRALTALTPDHWQRLAAMITRISSTLDFLLIDTAAGISDNVVDLLLMADRVLVVTSYEPPAIVDAYAVVKILTGVDRTKEIGVVVNSARDADQAGSVFRQLDLACSRFLNRALRFYGFVVQDPAVRDAVVRQSPIVELLPQAPASRCFRILASRLAGFVPGAASGIRVVRGGADAAAHSGGEETPRCA